MEADVPDHAMMVPTGSPPPPLLLLPPEGASTNSKAFAAEFTFIHLSAVYELGVSLRPIKVVVPIVVLSTKSTPF